ncbi:extracellular solute-binding protein [Arthrobacter sp. MI7-26]|uniref:ABC transporter substrate-binding protein n=1 Tax=Arthrobacter sp. MI7-26 TaxID=2993653 RepID=UPI002248EADA|nr:extracellular solute-binding protein [Arthrobacter sp. MI7-26]MCX2750066.1 extracellular solute-binding protein [Arthrobacter sp. MI7-26]
MTWWGWTPQPSGAERYIAAFNKEYPDIKVTYKQLTIDGWNAALKPALASSSGPDIYDINPGVRMDDFSSFAADLTPAMAKSLGSDWKSKVSPIGVDGLTTKSGKLAAISVGSTYSGSLWTNKNLFDQYHLTPPKTVDEWVNVCGVFKKNGIKCFVQGAAQVAFNRDTLQAISNSIEPGVWNKASTGDTKWTNPTIVKALTTWKRLFADGIMQDGALGVQQYPDANNEFMSGKSAMVMMGTWYMQYATTAGMTPAISAAGVANPKPFPIVPIPFPAASGAGSSDFALSGDSDYGLAVNNKSKVKAAATTFATWLGTSKAGQQEVANVLNDIPALKGIAPNWDTIPMTDRSAQQPSVQKLIDQAATVTEPRLGLVSSDLSTAFGVASTTVAEGKASPEQAAQTLQSSAEAAGLKFK